MSGGFYMSGNEKTDTMGYRLRMFYAITVCSQLSPKYCVAIARSSTVPSFNKTR